MTAPDLAVLNGRVLTMNPEQPEAEALAVRGDRISAIGSNAEIRALIGPETRQIDAGGNTVLPGFVEAHLHLFPGAFSLRQLMLMGVQGRSAVEVALNGYAAENPDEALLIGIAAEYHLFGEGIDTTRQMLDDVMPDRAVVLFSQDSHTAWANTVALERAGVLHGAELPPGNEIPLAPDGTAIGVLKESGAIMPVLAQRSSGGREMLGFAGVEPDEDLTGAEFQEDAGVMLDGLKLCASYGFTSLHNMDGNFYQLRLLRSLEEQGMLLCRTEVPFHLTPEKPVSALVGASQMSAEYNSDRLRCGRVKMFADGVIESATALLVDDYADQAGWKGEPQHTVERFNEAVIEADRRGLQVSVHAIGDGAVRMVLDGYEAAQNINGKRDSRHRIEHAELCHPDDFPRFSELGVIASMQPSHPPGAMDFPLEPYLSKTGNERWPTAFVWRDFLEAGVTLAFSSDWPIADINPMRSIKAAVMRKPWGKEDADQSLTLLEALRAYTADGAFAGHDEDRLGSLKTGMLADIVVMDSDLEAMDPEDLDQSRAAVTICGGGITWEA